ncbi:hypothetical protein M2150_001783 [Lachnospiraceae bacterium PM6-15]|uniref:hypothetical protein n=1 Tax=Ohessyouella blattaphilus TaxID=2949333 RepID=UPI003E2AD4D4
MLSMKCEICDVNIQSGYSYNDDEEVFLCNECTEKLVDANLYQGREIWELSLKNDDEYFVGSKNIIEDILKDMPYKNVLMEDAQYIREVLEEQIKFHLEYYSRDILVALCVLMRQAFRLSIEHNNSGEWRYDMEYSATSIITKYAFEIENFEGGMFVTEAYPYNLISALVLIRTLIHLDNNIELYKYSNLGVVSIRDLLYEALESQELNEHFAEYHACAQYEKPEDYEIKDLGIKEKLKFEGKDPDSIVLKANNIVKKNWGFYIEDAEAFRAILIKETMLMTDKLDVRVYRIFSLDELEKMTNGTLDRETIKSILEAFKVRKAPENLRESLSKGFYEMRNVVQFSEYYFLVPYEFMQCVNAFRSYVLSSHFIEVYSLNSKTENELTKVAKLTSTFIVYTMVDLLYENGYLLPMIEMKINGKKYRVPQAEIEKVNKNGYNLLVFDKNLKDIDILAYDKNNNVIYNIEVKNYKPAISIKEMIKSDPAKVEGKDVVRKTLEREELINKEISSFLSYLDISNKDNSIVKSYIVSARPNYYAQISDEVECITWREFCTRVRDKTL